MTSFPFDIVGFDLDGTLVDTRGDLGAAMNHALSTAGRPHVPDEQVFSLVGGGSKRMLARALDLTGGRVDADKFEQMHASLLEYYETHIADNSVIYPGGLTMLDALAGMGVKLAVVTNKLEHLAVQLLDELGLSSGFYTILGGDSLGPGKAKPAPDLIQAMIANGGGGRAAYVGDTTFDTIAAAAAGITCVAVSFGYNNKPVGELGADAVIDHFDELIGTLQRF